MRWIKRLAAAIGALAGLYFLAALAGSLIPVNRDWREARAGVTIYLATNGFHTGLILPASEAGIDWLERARPEHLADPQLTGRWLLFGWGDRDFYLNTPTWAEFTPRTAIVSLVGSGQSLVHIDHLMAPEEAADIRRITLTPAEYRKLAAYIDASFGPDRAPIEGYGDRDLFYEGARRYSLFKTCNNWTAQALAAAGVKVGLWTPFQGGVMRWFPAPPSSLSDGSSRG